MSSIFKNYYSKIIKYDLINKFHYKNINEIPKLKKIILNMGCKRADKRQIASSLLALELISMKTAKLTKSRKPNIVLKIRKGQPVGCKVVLENLEMYQFLFKLYNEVFPNTKNFSYLKLSKTSLISNSFSFSVKDLINFRELENQFYLFKQLPSLNVTFVLNTKSNKDVIYFMKSLNLPIK